MGGKEQDDLRLKLMLVLVRDRQAMQGRIRSVRFVREYDRLPDELGAIALGRMTDGQQAALASAIGIRNRPAKARCDLYLNDIGYRIEALGRYPTFVANGLTAAGLRAICAKLDIPGDALCCQLQACLHTGLAAGGAGATETGETGTRLCEWHLSPDDRQYWQRVISYLLFAGNEEGEDAVFAADGVLDYANPLDTESWAIVGKEEAVEALWPRLRIGIDGDGAADGDKTCFRIWAPIGNGRD